MYFTTTSGEFVRILALLCRNQLAGFVNLLKAPPSGTRRRDHTMKISHAGAGKPTTPGLTQHSDLAATRGAALLSEVVEAQGGAARWAQGQNDRPHVKV